MCAKVIQSSFQPIPQKVKGAGPVSWVTVKTATANLFPGMKASIRVTVSSPGQIFNL